MIDSHCHLNFDTLTKNINKIIQRAKDNNITSILSINTKMQDFDAHYNFLCHV